ncbi:MarR family winged helix-turn-helix transcriptional regulator [Fundicoccus culcitae]|uniref:MarR family transcriptional regulator n=1 Tax=Fundicoccus culcitae TaxID=2969821 RepID=A0ABY5P8R4_9LACT|nr:MarR family transcriptional regulator [Fundicoccus culcitae]UUX34753.1 MarR family transcriptional regulator [Fundicoccus culcitae]
MDDAQVDLRLFRTWLNASKSLFENVKKDIASHELTLENFMVMEMIYSKGPQYIQTLSEKLSIPSGSITYVVNKLEKLGVVVRELDEDNKRYCKVVLTEQGEALFNEVFPKHVAVIRENFEVLTESEKLQLTNLLKKMGLNAKAKQ